MKHDFLAMAMSGLIWVASAAVVVGAVTLFTM
jgi:hypothetical protein